MIHDNGSKIVNSLTWIIECSGSQKNCFFFHKKIPIVILIAVVCKKLFVSRNVSVHREVKEDKEKKKITMNVKGDKTNER